MLIPPISDEVSVVLVGNFNPAIFSPAWFAMNEIVSAVDAVNAAVDIIHPDVCRFKVGDLLIQAEPQRFTVACPGSRHEMAQDLVLSTFGTVLPHTPIHFTGINRTVHFDTGDFYVRDEVGQILAPRGAWGEWAKEIDASPGPGARHGGLMRVAMRAPTQGSKFAGLVLADVQPSMLPQLALSGIVVAVNHHFDLKIVSEDHSRTDRLITLLEAEWRASIEKADFVITELQTVVESAKRNAGSATPARRGTDV